MKQAAVNDQRYVLAAILNNAEKTMRMHLNDKYSDKIMTLITSKLIK